MFVCAPDASQLLEYEAHALRRTTDLLRSVPPDLALASGTWTARDVAAHLVTVIGRYLDPGVTLARSPREVDEINRRELDALEGVPVNELLEMLAARAAEYTQFWPLLPLDQQFPFHSGVSVDVAALRSNWIGELVIHGRDVALAAGTEVAIDDAVGLLLVRLLLQVLPGYLRAADIGTAVLVVEPAGGEPVTVRVDSGTTQVQAGGDAAAARLRGSPATLALLLYHRLDVDGALAAGASVGGDPAVVRRVLAALEQP